MKEQFERLSEVEIQIMYWLALFNEPLSPLELQDKIPWLGESVELIPVLESLLRRSLLQKSTQTGIAKFYLQPVVSKYVASQLMKQVYQLMSAPNEEDLEKLGVFKSLGLLHSGEEEGYHQHPSNFVYPGRRLWMLGFIVVLNVDMWVQEMS